MYHLLFRTSVHSLFLSRSIALLFSLLFQYLRKQTLALREVNDSRMKIYEQLEVSIQELENKNHRLSAQTNADKKHIQR